MSTKQKEIADLITQAARATAYVWSPQGRRELGESNCNALKTMITTSAIATLVAAFFERLGAQAPKKPSAPSVPTILPALHKTQKTPRLRSIPMPPPTQAPLLTSVGSAWEAPEIRRARDVLGVGPRATLGEIHMALARKLELHRSLRGTAEGEKSLQSAAIVLSAVTVAAARGG